MGSSDDYPRKKRIIYKRTLARIQESTEIGRQFSAVFYSYTQRSWWIEKWRLYYIRYP